MGKLEKHAKISSRDGWCESRAKVAVLLEMVSGRNFDTPAATLPLKFQSRGRELLVLFERLNSISIHILHRKIGRTEVIAFSLTPLSDLPRCGVVGALINAPPDRRCNADRSYLRFSHRFNDCRDELPAFASMLRAFLMELKWKICETPVMWNVGFLGEGGACISDS